MLVWVGSESPLVTYITRIVPESWSLFCFAPLACFRKQFPEHCLLLNVGNPLFSLWLASHRAGYGVCLPIDMK